MSEKLDKLRASLEKEKERRIKIGSFSFPQNTIFPIWVLSVNC